VTIATKETRWSDARQHYIVACTKKGLGTLKWIEGRGESVVVELATKGLRRGGESVVVDYAGVRYGEGGGEGEGV
jgi:hypothetical protein